MKNPYQILGISETASMEEVKKAYRKLSRIYHPDANINNPNKDQAEAKFKEIQAAYQQIVDEKEHGGSRTTYSNQSSYGNTSSNGQGNYQQRSSQGQYYGGFEDFFGGFGGYGRGREQDTDTSRESTLVQAAANYVRNGYYREALNVLANVPQTERSAAWYYYSAKANAGVGNNITAQENAATAVQMEPNNYVYRDFLQKLQSGESWYTQRGGSYGRPSSSLQNCLCECLMLQCLCNGGICIPCC